MRKKMILLLGMVSSSAFAGQTSSGGGIAVRQSAESLFGIPVGQDLREVNLDDEIEIEGGVFRVIGLNPLTGNIIVQSPSGVKLEIPAGSNIPTDLIPQQ